MGGECQWHKPSRGRSVRGQSPGGAGVDTRRLSVYATVQEHGHVRFYRLNVSSAQAAVVIKDPGRVRSFSIGGRGRSRMRTRARRISHSCMCETRRVPRLPAR